MWRLMLAFKSPLVLRPWCPPLYPPSFSHTNTLTHTVDITHAGRYSLIYIASRKTRCFALLQHSADDEMRKNVHLCLFVCVCMKEGEVEMENVTSLCVYRHKYMYVDRMTLIQTVRTANEMP